MNTYRDRRGEVLLHHRNFAEITVVMCKQKSRPVWFSCRRNSWTQPKTFYVNLYSTGTFTGASQLCGVKTCLQHFFLYRYFSTQDARRRSSSSFSYRGASIPSDCDCFRIKILFTRQLLYEKESFKVSRQGRTPFYEETLALSAGTWFICQYI